ncbi:MAG: hypothetical protein HFP77_01635 [Methylococcales symbiont of Iophon sp. n. MRB-2018]|nr:MAG: hypothetical protein HFP77_01635 [Methylococcales symbiont of Iophon sp. n. MRB-2018]KAF3980349.1 MAG: hypothetical protein HFP76_02545 [Methylococcales symbiont of Iophon sp. n. MRB-2018]
MNINAVQMMREIRNKVDLEIKDLSWQEEAGYLKQHNQSFIYLTQKTANKSFHPTANESAKF